MGIGADVDNDRKDHIIMIGTHGLEGKIKRSKDEYKPNKFKCEMCGLTEMLINRKKSTTRRFCESCRLKRNSTNNREKYRRKESDIIMKKPSTKSKQKPVAKKSGPAKKGGKY